MSFRIKKRWSLATVLVIILITLGLLLYFTETIKQEEPAEKPQGFFLQEVPFGDLKGFDDDRLLEAVGAFRHSCAVIEKRPINFYAPAEEWKKTCERFLRETFYDEQSFRRFVKNNFKPYKVFYDGSPEGLFTGYYIPRLAASKVKTDEFNVPIYAIPDDIVYVNVEEFYPECKKCKIIGRVGRDKNLKPYPKRHEIDRQDIKANVLVWLKDPVDNFILHIQGSGKVHFPDGSEQVVGFAGYNGHEFRGIGSLMMDEQLIPSKDYSMPSISNWLKNNPKKAQELMWKNPRYIFFRTLKEHVVGAQGVPLTAERSIAVDRNFISYGVPIWLNTFNADKEEINRLVVAQDTGGAIRGAVRGDFFWGEGDAAFMQAGRMKSKGEYYVLLPVNNHFTLPPPATNPGS